MSGELIKQQLKQIEKYKIDPSKFIIAVDEAKEHVQRRREIRKKDPLIWNGYTDEYYNLTIEFYDIVRERLVAVSPAQHQLPASMSVDEWKQFLLLFFHE